MFSRGGFDAKASRCKLSGTGEAGDAFAVLARGNPDKALVMKYVGQLVADGYAQWSMLDNGEVVEAVVQGQFEGEPGVVVLTAGRVLLVNEAQWKVGTASIPIDPALTVQGWQDDKVASLTFQAGDRQVTIDSISDRPLAQEMAGRVRARVAEAG